MDRCREAFEKDFPIPAHWIEFNEKLYKYHCPHCADYGASMYQAKWEAWQHQQKRIEDLERKLQIKTRHCQFYEQSRKGHRSLAIARKKQINSALEQIEKLYSKAESNYKKERNSYYNGMLSGLDLAEQAIRGELEEQALKGGEV